MLDKHAHYKQSNLSLSAHIDQTDTDEHKLDSSGPTR